MSQAWNYYVNRPPIDIEERPILDQNRNRIIAYNHEFSNHPKSVSTKNDMSFPYLRQRGYELIGQIGRGGYGVVYKARSIEDVSKMFAIKINFDVVARSTVYLEVAFFHLMRKKGNLPQIADFFFHQCTPHIVLEYFEHQQFIHIFQQTKTLKDVKHYLIQILKGLSILKNMGIYHRDIKPLNFLYNMHKKKGIVIDFGLAQVDSDYVKQVVEKKYEEVRKKVVKSDRINNAVLIKKKEQYNLYRRLLKANQDHGFGKIGTQSYVPLQTIFHGENQGHQCQIWSVGVIFLQFLTQKLHFFNEPKISAEQNAEIKYASYFVMQLAYLFGTGPVQDQLRKLGCRVTFPKKLQQKADFKKMIILKSMDDDQNQNAYDLLTRMVALKPDMRISAEDAIWHPFFDQIRSEHFTTPGQIKWYQKQKQKRTKKVAPQQEDANVDANVMKSPENPTDCSKPKGQSKQRKEDQIEKQSSSEDSSDSIQNCTQDIKNNVSNQVQNCREAQKQETQKNQQMEPQEQKAAQQSRINIQSVSSIVKRQKKVVIKQQTVIKTEKIQTENRANIMDTIRKYVKGEEIPKALVSQKIDRIVINADYEQPKPKKTKVIRKSYQKPNEENEIKSRAQKINQQKQIKKEVKDEETKKSVPQGLKIDEKLQQFLKKQDQRIKKQIKKQSIFDKLPKKKITVGQSSNINEEYSEYYESD